jgi:hypothetical protein
VQQFVPQPKVTVGGRDWFLNINLVVMDGRLAGGFCRLCMGSIVNISRSGAMLPLFVARRTTHQPSKHRESPNVELPGAIPQ